MCCSVTLRSRSALSQDIGSRDNRGNRWDYPPNSCQQILIRPLLTLGTLYQSLYYGTVALRQVYAITGQSVVELTTLHSCGSVVLIDVLLCRHCQNLSSSFLSWLYGYVWFWFLYFGPFYTSAALPHSIACTEDFIVSYRNGSSVY